MDSFMFSVTFCFNVSYECKFKLKKCVNDFRSGSKITQ